jgi:hypothetical protein
MYVPYIIEQAKGLNFIEFDQKQYPIEYFFCADWIMMVETCGLYGPTSDYPCIWCEAKSDTFYLNQNNKKRQVLTNDVIKQKYSKPHYGYKYASLLTEFIPFQNCIPDLLHLFIRISEVLLTGLIEKLIFIDDYRRSTTQTNLEKYKNISKYFEFLNEKCKILAVFLTIRQTTKIKACFIEV